VRIVGVFGIVRSVRYLRRPVHLSIAARMQRALGRTLRAGFISEKGMACSDVFQSTTIWRDCWAIWCVIMCLPTAGCSSVAERSRFTSTRRMELSSEQWQSDQRSGDRSSLFQMDKPHLNTSSDSE